eukprot:NODE_4271_length_1089_cov_25.933747_g4072_i0.p1 GENE.NODE_4271_length_1089_cov_25.933747_g4072_i0~~NODE_4271_length_1089_cov_25.933747_g4072_i0.p1  ORF type:complete len:308 (+),score=23.79 NODE_4271_length_1089_cov_25.933747_g4072_i0:164-1087(+)
MRRPWPASIALTALLCSVLLLLATFSSLPGTHFTDRPEHASLGSRRLLAQSGYTVDFGSGPYVTGIPLPLLLTPTQADVLLEVQISEGDCGTGTDSHVHIGPANTTNGKYAADVVFARGTSWRVCYRSASTGWVHGATIVVKGPYRYVANRGLRVCTDPFDLFVQGTGQDPNCDEVDHFPVQTFSECVSRCSGLANLTATPSISATPTGTNSLSHNSHTSVPTRTVTPSPTSTHTNTRTVTSTITHTATSTSTNKITSSPTASAYSTCTLSRTTTITETVSCTRTDTRSHTCTPSVSPTDSITRTLR